MENVDQMIRTVDRRESEAGELCKDNQSPRFAPKPTGGAVVRKGAAANPRLSKSGFGAKLETM